MYSLNFGLIEASPHEIITLFSYHCLNHFFISSFTISSFTNTQFWASESRQNKHLLLQAAVIRTQTLFCLVVFSFDNKFCLFSIF
ncbi:MAG: hypothetical protein Q8S84_02030 [bacterium]|nr:hypothetical protein [bacterium]MDP3380334.1 hypothetical protein [bacterium]